MYPDYNTASAEACDYFRTRSVKLDSFGSTEPFGSALARLQNEESLVPYKYDAIGSQSFASEALEGLTRLEFECEFACLPNPHDDCRMALAKEVYRIIGILEETNHNFYKKLKDCKLIPDEEKAGIEALCGWVDGFTSFWATRLHYEVILPICEAHEHENDERFSLT